LSVALDSIDLSLGSFYLYTVDYTNLRKKDVSDIFLLYNNFEYFKTNIPDSIILISFTLVPDCESSIYRLKNSNQIIP